MNILFLMAGSERAGNRDNNYPISLLEIKGKPLIEWHIDSIRNLNPAKCIFLVRSEDATKYHLDEAIKQCLPSSYIIKLVGQTKGSACTALMAASFFNNDEPLLILSVDQLISENFATVVSNFKARDLDGGTIVFNSIHPRYSFVKMDDQNQYVLEASEKKPISRNATAGFYYFKSGASFLQAAQDMIRKDASIDESFYICPTFNEMILRHKKIGVFHIKPSHYYPMKSETQLSQAIDNIEKRGDLK